MNFPFSLCMFKSIEILCHGQSLCGRFFQLFVRVSLLESSFSFLNLSPSSLLLGEREIFSESLKQPFLPFIGGSGALRGWGWGRGDERDIL